MEISSVNGNNLVAAQVAASQQTRSPDAQAENREVIQAVRKLNETEFFGGKSELTFVLDRQTKRPLVRIIDKKTKEVIQQIPPDYVLRMAEDLKKGY
jgi:flagellar protein FlaG